MIKHLKSYKYIRTMIASRKTQAKDAGVDASDKHAVYSSRGRCTLTYRDSTPPMKLTELKSLETQ